MDALLQRWREIAAELSPELARAADWENDEPPPHLLHAFRPDGAGVERLLDGMPARDEVLDRLLRIYRAAGRETGHMYFVPDDPPPLDDTRALALAHEYLDDVRLMGEIACEWSPSTAERPGFATLADRDLTVEIGAPAPSSGPLQSIIYEIITEVGGAMRFQSEHAFHLREPLYYVANDYHLVHWALYPEQRDDYGIDGDPWAAYFELWRHGFALGYGDAKVILSRR